jgi:hypothetical protein
MLEIRQTELPAQLDGAWDSPFWSQAETVDIAHFRPEGSEAHRPKAQARLLYDDVAVYGMFRVEDRYVRCVHTGFQVPVCRDSCVEFFVQPRGTGGYFNFEINCGGAILSSWITDPRRTADGFEDYQMLSVNELRRVRIVHSMPERVEPELPGPITWTVAYAFALAETTALSCGDDHWLVLLWVAGRPRAMFGS